jgi:hypothetical protein
MSAETSKTKSFGFPKEMNVLIPEGQVSGELQTDCNVVTADEPDTKAYWPALCDIILRTIFAVAILAVGCWIPEARRSQIPFSYAATDPVLSLASLVSKVAAGIFGAMACWSFRCVFEMLWRDRIEQSRRLLSE